MRLKTITSILSLTFALLSCTREDLSSCIETGTTISFNYQWAGSVSSDIPMERADMYIFDSNRRFVYSLVDNIGPFTTSRTYNVPLPEGTYTAVAWGDKDGAYHINPEKFIVGQTTLDQVQIVLKALLPATKSAEGATIQGPSTPLYHAIRHNIVVKSSQNTPTVMHLVRNTKEINLSVRFVHRDGSLCKHEKNRCTPTILSNDGIFNFENSPLPCSDFSYLPTTIEDKEGGHDARFYKMRLSLDEQSKMRLTKLPASGSTDIHYEGSLMKWLKGTGFTTQEKLDETHIYTIELSFLCEEETTNATVSITVNGWKYVETSDEV